MTDPSGSSPSPPGQEPAAPTEVGAPDDVAYPAVWTRRILVGLAALGVAVVVAAVVWASGRSGGSNKAALPTAVSSAQASDAVQGSASTATISGPTSSTVASSSSVTATTTRASTRTTAATNPTATTSAPTTVTPTTAEASSFYDRGSVGPCQVGFTGNDASSSSSSGSDTAQVTVVVGCMVHAWAWQLTTTQNGLAGMDALASQGTIPTLLNLGHFLNHLHLAPAGCTVSGASGHCTYTDGTTDVVLAVTQSAAYTYGWLVTNVSWGPVGTTPTTSTSTTTSTTSAPAAP